ncbi:hypothetical protein FRC12_009057 [Ceratobasidium sp. 428]|nr:hypothetical protein FRC12_009057 [Ceratobasidium sp. 428]
MSPAALQGKTVWNSSPEELGLTVDHLQAEQKWLKDFNEAADQADWEAWKDFWTDDAFFTWGHKVRVEGKPALTEHFGRVLPPFEKPGTHKVTRQSFDVKQGLIHQTVDIIRAIRGDPQAKTYTIPTVLIIHKKIGESKTSGMEAYSDMSEILETIKVVSAKAA